MELDDLKTACQSLESGLARQHALQLEQFRQGEVRKMRGHLRPLWWGQVAQMLVYWSLALGAAGLLATLWFHRWSRSPDRPRLAKAMRESVIGSSLLRAQARLDEIERFERA